MVAAIVSAVAANYSVATGSLRAVTAHFPAIVEHVLLFSLIVLKQTTIGTAGSNTPDFYLCLFAIFLGSILHIFSQNTLEYQK